MKITLESTTQIVETNGVECRVWQGKTNFGVEVSALIVRIAAKQVGDLAQFEAELTEHKPPRPVWPLRMIL